MDRSVSIIGYATLVLIFIQFACSVLAASPSTTALPATSTSAISIDNCCTSTQDATVFSLIYGYPLMSYVNFTSTILTAIGGPNRIITQTGLANPNDQNVVRPNVDTLYSTVFIDLSTDDLVVTVPRIDDGRYWVFPFYDPFGNQFADISITNNSPYGQYLVRRADDALVQPGLQMTAASKDCIPKYQGIVNFPTTYGTLLVRILLRQNSTEDLAIVNKYQGEINVTTTPRTVTQPDTIQAPPLSSELLNTDASMSMTERILELTARLAPYNQPAVFSDRYRVASILGQAGLAGGVYRQPSSVDLNAATLAASATELGEVRNVSNLEYLGNGWITQRPAFQGDFGTHYPSRAYVARVGYLELAATEALYPSFINESSGTETILADQALLFTFSAPPPLLPSGFWSLTVYDGEQFLIPNPLNRYEVGDRSNLTYPDGRPVYGGGAPPASFQVLLQPADVAPPANWTSNWLPGPAGGGDLSFVLRWYAPGPAFTNGSYAYPTVEQLDAIT